MKRKSFFVLGAALGMLALVATAPPAMAAVSVGFSIHAGDPYHGFSLHLSSAPNVILVPGTRVGYVENYDGDLYSYGNEWYLDQGDQWYCARSYDGPFVAISAAALPFDTGRFPAGYRRGFSYARPTSVRGDNDRGSYDRDHSFRTNDRGWSQRDNRTFTRANDQNWNRPQSQGWNRAANRGGRYSGNGRSNGHDRDGGRG